MIIKAKYIETTRTSCNRHSLQFESHELEHGSKFSYLGSQINSTNTTGNDIQARTLNGNQCHNAYSKLIKSIALNKSLKLIIYKSITRLVVTYARDTGLLTQKDEQ